MFNFRKFVTDTINNGGNSLALSGDVPKTGYMFSILGTEKYLDMGLSEDELCQEIDMFIHENRDRLHIKGFFVGSWVNDGKICMDVSRNIDDKETAVYYGIQNKQEAIYDVENQRAIYIPKGQHTGKDYRDTTANKMLAQKFVENFK